MDNLIKLYKKLHSKTKNQRKAINNGDYDRLLNILDEKKELIDKIDTIGVKEYLQQQDNPEESLSKLKSVIREVKNLEDENADLMQGKHNNMKEKFQDINIGEKSRKGYQSGNNYEAKFIDKKS